MAAMFFRENQTCTLDDASRLSSGVEGRLLSSRNERHHLHNVSEQTAKRYNDRSFSRLTESVDFQYKMIGQRDVFSSSTPTLRYILSQACLISSIALFPFQPKKVRCPCGGVQSIGMLGSGRGPLRVRGHDALCDII